METLSEIISTCSTLPAMEQESKENKASVHTGQESMEEMEWKRGHCLPSLFQDRAYCEFSHVSLLFKHNNMLKFAVKCKISGTALLPLITK